MRSIFARYLAYTIVILLPIQSISVVYFATVYKHLHHFRLP